MWPQLLMQLTVALVIGYVTRPKVAGPKSPAFEDFEFPQVDEGTPQCVIFGDCWVDDWMVIGLGDYRIERVKVKV